MEIKHSFVLSISILNTETGHIKYCVMCCATSVNCPTSPVWEQEERFI